MSKTEPSGDELDRDTITANTLANWLNEHGPDWVLEIEPLDEETEYVGFVDGRFRAYTERGINFVALDYLDDIADRARKIDYVSLEDSPLERSEDEDDES
ncbi:hypothetical protein [Haloplanus sp. C73]|uniref:hypothetical protein n=1 Tax=Haloplanus sp. C73 TaxID=3421641 RepID=UPI003EBB0FB2